MSNASHSPDEPWGPDWLRDDFARSEAKRIVEVLLPLVEPLAMVLGPKSEVVLHDLSKLPMSIVAISGSISGRNVGDASTDISLLVLERSEQTRHHIGYRSEMPNGTVCRSSSILLYGESKHPVVALAINTDIEELLAARDLLDSMVSTVLPLEAKGRAYDDVASLTDALLTRAIDSIGVPVSEMSKKQKINVVRELEKRGFFFIREAADRAAAALGVTRYSIYNYLNQLDS
jgi:predicted transcriptional regulator YheO